MDPEEEFMMWILPQIMEEEEELEGNSTLPPPRQKSDLERLLEKIFLIIMAFSFFVCILLALIGE
ncbi:MAG: hypothetical protein N3D16_02940 [Anaerolineales bacterium]|nr:hypothetical protein [Anaerolineales bacterium]